jgi:hypothetical protein
MCDPFRYVDIIAYDSIGLVSTNNDLLVPVHRHNISESIKVYHNDWLWIKQSKDAKGVKVYTLQATSISGKIYKTVEPSCAIMYSCLNQLKKIQAAVKATMLKRKLAALCTLRQYLPIDIVLLCISSKQKIHHA